MQQAVIPDKVIPSSDFSKRSSRGSRRGGGGSNTTRYESLLPGSPVALTAKSSRRGGTYYQATAGTPRGRGGFGGGGSRGDGGGGGGRGRGPSTYGVPILAVDLTFAGTYTTGNPQIVHALGGLLVPPSEYATVKSWTVGGVGSGGAGVLRARPPRAPAWPAGVMVKRVPSARGSRGDRSAWPT
jgi:hypothetical protein